MSSPSWFEKCATVALLPTHQSACVPAWVVRDDGVPGREAAELRAEVLLGGAQRAAQAHHRGPGPAHEYVEVRAVHLDAARLQAAGPEALPSDLRAHNITG